MSDQSPGVQAILFDLYGTLLQEPPFEHCFPDLAAACGVSLEAYVAARQATIDDAMIGRLPTAEARAVSILASLGRDDADGLARTLAVQERQARWGKVQLYPAARETLRAVRERGFRIGLVSDCTDLMGRSLLEELNLIGDFDGVALSYEVGHAKPSPHIYRAVLDQLGVVPSRCVYVGDGGSDEINGARALGMTTVRIDQEHSFGRSAYPAPSDHVIVRLDELLHLPPLAPERSGFPRLDLNWVKPDLAVGARVDPTNVSRLKIMGIGAVVDLRIEESDDPDLLAQHDISFLHLPMYDEHALTQDQLRQGSRWVAEQRAAGKRVLVHCQHGVGRSVMLAAAVLINEGMSTTEALDHLRARRPKMAFSPRQLAAMYEYRSSR